MDAGGWGWIEKTATDRAYELTETRLLPAKTQRLVEFLQERLGQQARTRAS